MNSVFYCLLAALCLASATIPGIDFTLKGDLTKPLVQYVGLPDFNYRWSYDSSFRGSGYTVYVLNMTSQRYIPPGGATPELWKHWLSVCVPDDVDRSRASTAMLYVDGGTNTEAAPTTWSNDRYGYTETLCQNTKIVTAYLSDVPSQPYVFKADPAKIVRSEDNILAYGWARILNDTHNPLWITRLAMVKSAVRAMDTVQDFALSLRKVPFIFNFIVGGSSKRGWVTWLTGSVDTRVSAIIPNVMPIPNMLPNLHTIPRCLGNWGYALQDYVNNGVTRRITDPAIKYMTEIEDPINYNRFLNIPKLIIVSTKDEFFLPDQPKFFIDSLIGERHLVSVPNGDHPAVSSRSVPILTDAFYYLANTSAAFINQITTRSARPTYKFKLNYSNSTASVEFWNTGSAQPSQVRLWQGTPPKTTQRDFRLFTEEGIQLFPFTSTTLSPVSRNYWKASVSKPAAGWTGFFIDATYKTNRGQDTFYVTSVVNVVPDRYPFPPCYETNTC